MTALTIRLPDSVHRKIKELAANDGVSVNQFIASAAAEKMASVMTLDWLRAEAAQGKRADFLAVLAASGQALAQDVLHAGTPAPHSSYAPLSAAQREQARQAAQALQQAPGAGGGGWRKKAKKSDLFKEV